MQNMRKWRHCWALAGGVFLQLWWFLALVLEPTSGFFYPLAQKGVETPRTLMHLLAMPLCSLFNQITEL